MGIAKEEGLGLGVGNSGSDTEKIIEKGIISLHHDPSIYIFTRRRKRKEK